MDTPLAYNSSFQIQTNHWIRAWWNVTTSSYVDRFRFSLLSTGDYDGFWDESGSASSLTYLAYQDIYLFSTYTGFFSPSPIITGINIQGDPARGGSGYVEIYGQYFDGLQSVSVSGSGVSVTPTFQSDNQINVSYTIAPSAPTGARNFTVTTLFGPSNSASFTVYDATPQISSISPDPWPTGTTTSFTVNGSYFGSNPSLSVSEPGVTGSGIAFKSDTQINAWASVASGSPGGTATVTVTSNGYSGSGFQAVPAGGGAFDHANVNLVPFSISQTPSIRDLSTGGPEDPQDAVIASTLTPSTITYSPVYSSGLLSNPNSTCQATLSFSPGSGMGSVDTTVTADNPAGLQNCSGVFYAIATYNGAVSPGGTLVRVPPQILVQLLYGESHGQGAIGDHVSQMAVGEVVKNRFAQPQWFGSVSTYQAAITPSQFLGIATQITDGAKPDVINAGSVFSGYAVSVANAGCFFSPTYADWLQIYSALVTQTTVLPPLNPASETGCYQEKKQLIFKYTAGFNADGRGAPAFIFEQEREPSEPAVIQID